MRGRGSRGFTLAEALVTLLLVSVVLGIVAGLSKEYADVIRWSSDRDKSLFGPDQAVERVRGELAEAVRVITPSATQVGSVSQLVFERIDPGNEERLSATPSTWNPIDSRYLLRVRYAISGGALTREVTFADGTVRTQVMADGVAGFSARTLGDGSYLISASFSDERTVRSISSEIRVRIGQ